MDLEWKVPEGGHVIRDAQKVWCAVFKEVGTDNWLEFYDHEGNYSNPYKLDQLPIFLTRPNLTLIAHNQLGADLHIMRRFFGIDFTILPDTIMGMPCTFIDTLSWSRRLWPDRHAVKGSKSIHGLEAWGIRTGIAKPKVEDWSDQPIEVYLNRCREDVLINEATYLKLLEEKNR